MSTVQLSGPFFDGRWDSDIRDFMHNTVMDVADEGLKDLRSEMARTYRVPTGAYESTVRVESLAYNRAQIYGEGKVYAWWLEGIGSRNYPKTVFPGYHLWERESIRLEAQAVRYTEKQLYEFLDKVNV